jgi:hypothetical protein
MLAFFMRTFFRSISFLSIDVALGAIVGSIFLSSFLNVRMSLPTILILGLTVWSIYTFDHLLDSKKIGLITTERHLFHIKYHVQLSKILAVVLLLIGALVFFVSTRTLIFGTALGCSVLVYFLSIHFLNWKVIIHKEMIISIIYSLGIFLGPISLYEGQFTVIQILIGIVFFLIVLLNVLIFSLFDYHSDKLAKFPSLILRMGIQNSKIIIGAVSILASLLITSIFYLGHFETGILFLVMLLVLQLLFWFESKNVIVENYRFLGDGIFLLPLIFIL